MHSSSIIALIQVLCSPLAGSHVLSVSKANYKVNKCIVIFILHHWAEEIEILKKKANEATTTGQKGKII
jgi:hypothetical protein